MADDKKKIPGQIFPQDVADIKLYTEYLKEAGDNMKELENLSSNLASHAQTELYYQEQSLNLGTDLAGQLRDKDTLERAQATNKKNQFDIAQALLIANENEKLALEENLKVQEDIENSLKEQIEKREILDEQIENSSKGMIGFLGKIPGLGGASKKALEVVKKQLEGGASETEAMEAGMKKFKQEAVAAGAAMMVAFAVDAFKEYSNVQRDVGRNLGISAGEADYLHHGLKKAALQSNDLLATSVDLMKTNSTLNQIRGTAVQFSDQELIDANRLLKTKVLTVGALGEISKLANISGTTIRETYLSQIDGVLAAEQEHGVRLDMKSVLEESANTTGQIRAQMGGSAKEISNAVATAKQLGMELNQVAAAGKQMLDFQTSIENELQAELFLGKELNLEKARLASLTGDYQTLAEEIDKNVGNFYEFSKLNVLQQDALAKAMGTTSDALSDQLLKKADLNALATQARLDGRDDIADNMEQLSVQDTMNASMEKFKGTMADILTAVMPLILGFADLVGYISESSIAMGALATIATVAGIAATVSAVTSIYTTFAKIPYGIGIPLAIGTVAGLMTAISHGKAKAKSIKDGVIDPDGGLVVSGEKGSIQIDKGDSLIAGTDLHGNNTNDSISPKKQGNEATERTKRFQAESIALLKQLNVAVAASTPTAMIASIAYSGFDAVKADTHYGTKFR